MTGLARGRRNLRAMTVRFGVRVGLVGLLLTAMGSVAMVAGAVSTPSVMAPPAPPPPLALALAPPADQVPPVDLSSLPAEPPVPAQSFLTEAANITHTYTAADRLSEATLRAFASIAGWPESLHDELLVVAACESRNRPLAQNGVMRGLMQLHPIWFRYSGVSEDGWSDPVTNLRVALAAYNYDIRRGNPAWHQWQCKPDGTVAPAPPPPNDADLEADAPAAATSADATPAATATGTPSPTPTPAPWDQKPPWPPQKATPAPSESSTPSPEASASMAGATATPDEATTATPTPAP